MNTSVQGCLLNIWLRGCWSLSPADCTQMRTCVIAQRGSRDTPMLTYEQLHGVSGAVWHK
jgi:hypothetical protein